MLEFSDRLPFQNVYIHVTTRRKRLQLLIRLGKNVKSLRLYPVVLLVRSPKKSYAEIHYSDVLVTLVIGVVNNSIISSTEDDVSALLTPGPGDQVLSLQS